MGVQIDGVNGTIKTGSSNVHNTGYSGQDGALTGNLTIDGNLGVAGTVTYEDITRVDAVGLSTFREGFGVGPLAGIALTAYKDGSIRSTGIITASSFVGDGSGLTGAGPSLANGVDNRVITASSATALNGEANLTFDGSTLDVTGDISISDKIIHTGDTNTAIRFPTADTITAETSGSEKLRITSAGQVLIGTSTPSTWTNRQLVIGDTTTASSFIEVRTTTSGTGHLLFADSAAGDANNYTGYLAYTHSSNHMSFHTDGGNERLRIGASGQIGIGGANYGSSGQVLTSGGASAAPSWAAAGGITYIDQWHLTTNQDLSEQDPLTGWTHSTHACYARLGTAMTESSGVFSFPATGMWLVSFSCWYYANARSSRWMQSRINTTENNSSYNQASAASNAIYNTGSNGYNSAYSQFIFDVTSTTNCKVRLSVSSQAELQYMGGRNFTSVKFIRLCGT